MNDSQRYDHLSDDQLQAIDLACETFEQALYSGAPISIESQLKTVPAAIRNAVFRELLAVELDWGIVLDQLPNLAEYLARFPDHDDDIRLVFREMQRPADPNPADPNPTKKLLFSGDIETAPERLRTQHPKRIGRYKIEEVIGSGSFGVVYRARDEQLNRVVALKVPHKSLVSRSKDAAAYLAEAQTVAGLDHPHIVPVFDFGSSDEIPCYIVSKYVDSNSLATQIKAGRPNYLAAARLVAAIAEALHAAHRQGLVHRDVKPGNILIDREGRAYLADFGLALREENIGRGPKYAGTPAYMSPEQARGEEHRVDGRSDVFSLGSVFYELLTGRQPFRAATQEELLHRVATYEPRPPRQYNEQIPIELERICMKALSKRASDRYSTAHDLAENLREFLAEESVQQPGTSGRLLNASSLFPSSHGSGPSTTFAGRTSRVLESGSHPLNVLPKGLSSFDEHDADFFLELLPGPRDRTGLPDSVRFWKTRIEERDAEKTFSVGLIYGPSGCGKSSLVKAGLLPRLSPDVTVVYVEATIEDTETRMLREILHRFPGLPQNLGLVATLAALRRQESGATSQRLLIVLDQFEQWLHAKREEHNTELLQALRQCDGLQIQCIVMVRDDFWLAVSRFMLDLEIDLVPGRNVALVDLFDLDHARAVLAAFGRAFGKLPESVRDTTKSQWDFLKQSILGLAEIGKVVPVRLSLFAETMKGKPWTPSALKEIGGAEGAGVSFLEEMFRARTANPQHRLHLEGAQRVLRALLPESGTDIKGRMRSYDELLQASGYISRPQDFDDLIRILDSESRLITPSERDSRADASPPATYHVPLATQNYQLTHDYLVPVLRKWLTAGQKATRRGRAELRLVERAAAWHGKPENRYLPTWWEYINIRLFTRWHQWTEPQRRMMRKAGMVHGTRWGTALLVTILIAIVSQQSASSARRRQLDEQAKVAIAAMQNSRAGVVPHAMADLERFPIALVIEELQKRSGDNSERQKLPLTYALAHFGAVDVEFLVSQIPHAAAGEADNIATALGHSKRESLQALHAAADASEATQDWRLKQRLAVVAVHLGDLSLAQDMCRLANDPIQRTIFIDQLASWQGDASRLTKMARTMDDPALQSGICLGIGSTPDEQVTEEAKQTWYPVLVEWYQHAPDKGVHSAASWALRHWQLQLPAIDASQQPADGCDWHVNSIGMTMLQIPAGSFIRQDLRDYTDPLIKGEPQKVTLTRPFLISDREVSVALYQQFLDDPNWPRSEKPKEEWHPHAEMHRTPGHPVSQVNWNDAAFFCNWLSHKEGRTPCYRSTGNKWRIPSQRDGEFDEWQLDRSADGYRLPTEAEWEYACRAGTITDYCFGSDTRWASQYAVYGANRTEMCGSKLPNGWGVFDVHGNVTEWCQDFMERHYGGYKEVTDPQGPDTEYELSRVLRGGWFTLGTRNIMSGTRDQVAISVSGLMYGFRVARTVTP